VEVNRGERVPADLVVLWTQDPEGVVFIKTDQLDGETDWKLRKPVKATQDALHRQAHNTVASLAHVNNKIGSNSAR
jgi:phospholipid-translocating ATPase